MLRILARQSNHHSTLGTYLYTQQYTSQHVARSGNSFFSSTVVPRFSSRSLITPTIQRPYSAQPQSLKQTPLPEVKNCHSITSSSTQKPLISHPTPIPDRSTLSGQSSPSTSATTTSPLPSLSEPKLNPKTFAAGSSKAKKSGHIWDADLDATMLSLHQSGINWRSIGVLLDRPFTTCYSRYLNTLRPALDKGWIPEPVKNVARLESLLARHREKMAAKAAKLKHPSETKLPKNEDSGRPSWDSASDQRIMDMVKEGKSWPQIGTALNRPYASCYTRYFTSLDPTLKTIWTTESIEKLNALAKKGLSWKKIGQELQIRPLACKTKWAELGKMVTQENALPKTKVVAFSKAESKAILSLVDQYGQDQWDQVLQHWQQHHSALGKKKQAAHLRIASITAENLRHQYLRLSRNKILWTLDEETTLIQQVLKRGTSEDQWPEIARYTGFHSAKECRTHWKELDMPVHPNPVAWSKVEQATFWKLWRQFGDDFEKLSKYCTNRSPADCQRYFENTTRDYPKDDPEQFLARIHSLERTMPYARQKYIFTKERSLRLQRAMRHFGKRFQQSGIGTWRWVANKVQRGLSATSCIDHWLYLRMNMDEVQGPLEQDQTKVKPQYSSSWSHEESKLLDQGIRELGSSWSEIQQRYLPWRTTRSIRQRWFIMSDKSAKVTEDEYYTIVNAGSTLAEIQWDSVAEQLPGWNTLPCKRVFETSYKYLVPNTVWQPEEDQKLIQKALEYHGRDWKAIASHFDGIQPARATLYSESLHGSALDPPGMPAIRTQKSAWQCRLRWCQLVEPLMPRQPILTATENGRSLALKLSKQLIQPPPPSSSLPFLASLPSSSSSPPSLVS